MAVLTLEPPTGDGEGAVGLGSLGLRGEEIWTGNPHARVVSMFTGQKPCFMCRLGVGSFTCSGESQLGTGQEPEVSPNPSGAHD